MSQSVSISPNTVKSGGRRKKNMKRKKTQKGGYNSGWSYGVETLGSGWTQFWNTFGLSNGQNSATIGTNDVEPIKNINANNPGSSILKYNVNGGGKKSKKSKKSKKGGSITSILNQAVVPFSLLTADLTLNGKERRSKYHTRKYR